MEKNIHYKVVDAMETYGGSFVQALAECFRRADGKNFIVLQVAFNEYWEKYTKMTHFRECEDCDGMGFNVGHNSAETHDPEDGSCTSCPVQDPCQTCATSGVISECDKCEGTLKIIVPAHQEAGKIIDEVEVPCMCIKEI